MKRRSKRQLALLLVFLMLVLLCVPGCGINKEEPVDFLNIEYEGSVTLRVLIDDSTTVLFDNTVSRIANKLEDTYPGVTVEVRRLSDYREEYGSCEKLREEIKAGGGPDVFVLAADASPGANNELSLFPDVNLAMRHGYFANLSAFYEWDKELNTDGLREEVMDAGIVDGFRFSLPLSYDYPVVFVNPEKLAEVGLDEDIFEEGIISLLDAVTALEDSDLAKSAYFDETRYLFNFFPDLVDYDTGRVLLDRAEMTKFLRSYLAFLQVKGYGTAAGSQQPSDYRAISKDSAQQMNWVTLGSCMRVGWSLGDVITETAVADYLDMDLKIYPLTGSDGEIVAEVRQYGAVNAGCAHPDLAYAFLREFLTEDGQWMSCAEQEPSLRYKGGSMFRSRVEIRGYPVRTEDSVHPLFYNAVLVALNEEYIGSMSYTLEVMEAFREQELNNRSIPILQEDIDVARYPTAEIEWNFAMDLIGDVQQAGYDPEGIDIEALVDQLILDLENHLWME